MLPGMLPTLVEPPPSGITMTAGADAWTGFSDGTFYAASGSISAEPVAGWTLQALNSGSGVTNLSYHGDVAAALSAMTLYVDGVPYSLAGASYIIAQTRTFKVWTSNTGPIFTDGHTYQIRIE